MTKNDKLEAAKRNVDTKNQRLAALLDEVSKAQAEVFAAADVHQQAEVEAHAEEVAEAQLVAQANEKRHHEECHKHCKKMSERRKARRDHKCDHTKIQVMTIDGKTHTIVAAHGLKLGHKGFESTAKEASRYRAACGLSVDAPHEEVHHHERFDQDVPANCEDCATALKGMESGSVQDLRSEYLTGDEHQAYVRARK